MNKKTVSTTQWNLLLAVLVLAALAMDTWASFYSERWNDVSTLGVQYGSFDEHFRLPIEKLSANSPLSAFGAKPGDKILFDRAFDLERHWGIGDDIGLTLYTPTGSRHLQIRSIADPLYASRPVATRVAAIANLALAWMALVVGALIGWRRADSPAMRMLSLSILMVALMSPTLMVPGGAADNLLIVATRLRYFTAYAAFTYFTLIYPEERPLWSQKAIRILFRLYLGLWSANCALIVLFELRAMPGTALGGLEIVNVVNVALLALGPAASLAALACSWHRARGVSRQRLAWIGVCTGTLNLTILLYLLNLALGQPVSELAINLFQYSVMCIAYLGIGYAMLRHRLFDFGFALNRALVVTVVSTFLLLAFSLSEWGVDKLLHFEGREKNVIFDALVALGIILSFHRIQHWVKHQVDHLFFHRWHEAAEKLRGFLDMAHHVTDASALYEKFINAIEEFSRNEGVAIYSRTESGQFERTQSTLGEALPLIDANHDVILKLKLTHKQVDLSDEETGPPGELALPMMVRGQLIGLVIVGLKNSGQHYRPDEIELLKTAAHQLGLDQESLRVVALERVAADARSQISALGQKNAVLEQKAEGYERETIALRLAIGQGI